MCIAALRKPDPVDQKMIPKNDGVSLRRAEKKKNRKRLLEVADSHRGKFGKIANFFAARLAIQARSVSRIRHPRSFVIHSDCTCQSYFQRSEGVVKYHGARSHFA